MTTRIRELRKSKGWTLQDLADLVGTTPQTVQRLETNNMTVSLEWLRRFAGAFGVNVTTLLERPLRSPVRYFGELGVNGAITPAEPQNPHYTNNKLIDMDISASDPIAINLSVPLGRNRPGDILIADRLRTSDLNAAEGRDCVIQLVNGEVVFRRVKKARNGHEITMPGGKAAVEQNLDIEWLAPVAMVVRYLPDN
jgi:transcriptional regulator with XRE-family HTH domain